MKKLLIPILFLVSCTPPPTCPSGPCVEQPGVAPTFAPVLVPAPKDTIWPDMMLEAEFQDDTIGQPRY